MRHKTIVASVLARAVAGVPVAAALAAFGLVGSHADGQMTTGNIYTQIRPLVYVTDNSSYNAGNMAVGLFDTGAVGGVFVPPETNTSWGIAVANSSAAPNNNPSQNYQLVGAATTFNIGSIMGGAFSSPEGTVNTVQPPLVSPTHIFGSQTITGTSSVSRTGVMPSLTYYNGVRSFVNIGGGYYNGTTGGPAALVAEVDPTNASWMPFAFNDVAAAGPGGVLPNNGGTAGVGGTRQNINGPDDATDQATSNVSFVSAGTAQSPTPTANADPGFLTVIPLVATTLAGVQGGTFTNFAGTNNATVGKRPVFNAPAASAFAGLPAGSYVVDTGAPTTSAGLLGTNYLNQYGQYYDFVNQQLMLFAPTNYQDQNLVGPGILFTVGRNSVGLANTGVNQLTVNGSAPINTTSGGGAAIPGDGIAGQQASAVYSTDLSHSNKAYINGIAALGLKAADHVTGISMGADQPGNPTKGVLIAGASVPVDAPSASTADATPASATPASATPSSTSIFPGPVNCALFFSVDSASSGIAGTGVAQQTALGKQSAQMYMSTTGNFLKQTGTNTIRYSSDLLGLGPNAGPSTAAAGRGQVDQLGDFVLESQRGYYDVATHMNGVDRATVQRNIDPSITSETKTPLNTGSGVTLGPDTSASIGPVTSTAPTSARGDVYGSTFDTYFTLDAGSPTRLANTNSAADILVNNSATAGGTTGYHVFAAAATMGLNVADGISALALSRPKLGADIGLIAGKNNSSSSLIGKFDENFYGDFEGVDAFNGGSSDYLLFTLTRGSPDLNIMDPVIGRNLSPADVFVSDFDGTFALYATAESLGLNPTTDAITGLKPIPFTDVPEPTTFAAFGLFGLMTLRRRRTPR